MSHLPSLSSVLSIYLPLQPCLSVIPPPVSISPSLFFSSSPSLPQPTGLARSRVLHMSLHPGHSQNPGQYGGPPSIMTICSREALGSRELCEATSMKGAGPCFMLVDAMAHRVS